MPADHITPHRIETELSAEEVFEIIGREVARRNGRDFDGRRSASFELVREVTKDGSETLSSIHVAIEWTGPNSAPAIARDPYPSSGPTGAAVAVELAGMEL